jgi:GNAT superfamily N-acetyltransferase
MSLVIQRSSPAEAELLLAIQIRAFEDDARLYPGVEVGGPPGYDSLAELQRDLADFTCYSLYYEGQLVGGMVIFERGGGVIHLARLFIDPAHHNRGLGTQAMHFMEQTHPAQIYTLDTPLYATRNQHFYERLGYRQARQFEADDLILIAYQKP